MKKYLSRLLTVSFLLFSVLSSLANTDRNDQKARASLQELDPELFTKKLSNIGPLCICEKAKLKEHINIKKYCKIWECENVILMERIPYALADLGSEAVATFFGGFLTLIIGSGTMFFAYVEKDPYVPRLLLCPTGFITLGCAFCALYRCYRIHAQEATRRAQRIMQLQYIMQCISNNSEVILTMIEKHPVKACCLPSN